MTREACESIMADSSVQAVKFGSLLPDGVGGHGRASVPVWQRVFRENMFLVLGGLLTVTVYSLAILAPWFSPHDPLMQEQAARLAAPGLAHPLGTDNLGRDVLSRLFWGARSTLLITSVAIAASAFIGVILGLISAYIGGVGGRIIDWVTDLLLVFPTLILGLAFVVALGQGVNNIIAAMTIAFAPRFVRLARGSALAVKRELYIEASRACGASDWRIMFRHILPNCSSELLVMGTLWLGAGVEIESSLSFLGLGVGEPMPSWGLMIKTGLRYLLVNPVLAVYPSIAIFVTVLGFNLVGDAIRDRLDPTLRRT